MPRILAGLVILLFTGVGEAQSGFGTSSMPPTVLTLQMIIDYAVDEQWKQLVLFDCIGADDCTRPYARPLLECFFRKGIYASVKSLTEVTELDKVLRIDVDHLGVVLLVDDIDLDTEDNLLHRIMMRHKNIRSLVLGQYISWLIVSTKWNNTQIFDAVNEWPVGVDSDVTIAMSFLTSNVIVSVLNQFWNKTCENLRDYGRRYDYARLKRSQSVAPPETTFVQDTDNESRTVMVFYTVAVYKIRVEGNASLVKEEWNTWSPARRFANRDKNLPKQRSDLRQYNMNFGLQNSSRFYGLDGDLLDSLEDEHTSSVETLKELINLFQRCLNVSANITNYVFRETAQVTNENNDLVHGIASGEIDIGAAYFDVDLDRNKMLSFTYPIVHFKRSIYFKPPETSSNIFLQPFSPKLLLCVIGTLIMIVAVMEIINYVTLLMHWKEDKAHFGLGEATLWCLSIMCMQGSPWTPRTRAGKTVLLSSLIFALIIYNSYSGFITSILSVKTDSISNVSDFYEYGYTFGCSKSDENYVSMNTKLRNFYVKALEENQMKVPEIKGLERTINGSYAFFIAETVAKRIFRNALMFQRCKINELQTDTPGTLALPLSDNSPYKRIINVSILRMWQYGMLRKLTLQIKPALLDCMGVLKYKQAHLNDVYGAFCILGIGAIASLGLFFLERVWASRQQLKGIQRRIVHLGHHHGHSQRQEDRARNPRSVVVTARLPMQIVGLNREIREVNTNENGTTKRIEGTENSGGRLLFPGERKQTDKGATIVRDPADRPQPFPYFP